MTAATKDEILTAALNALAQYPTVAQYVKAGDPRVLAQIGAQAAMLAMLAEQVEVAQFEPFVKARDGTVLADASLKGVLPLARSCRVALSVTNEGPTGFKVASGRRFVDAKGRIYEADADVTIAAGATGTVNCTQHTRRAIAHLVGVARPFYAIEVTQTEEQVYLTTLSVWKGLSEFAYQPDWFNVMPGDLAYQAETDERRRLWVRFGSKDVVGYGAKTGDQFELRLTECEGRITDQASGAVFNFEYSYTPDDGKIKAVLSAVVDEGAAPPTMSDLRVMARYPALYDHNAVYLGEFEFLLRRYLSPIRFLSVWNEQVEESVRGADVLNINKLFVSGLVTGMSDAAFQARVLDLISRADNSYKVVFVTTALTPVTVAITGKVSVVHDPATVESQVRAAILGKYGDGQPDVSKGMASPLRYQAIYRLLREQVPALQDELSDFSVTVTLPATMLPEHFLYVSGDSLSVTIERSEYGNGLWNY